MNIQMRVKSVFIHALHSFMYVSHRENIVEDQNIDPRIIIICDVWSPQSLWLKIKYYSFMMYVTINKTN